MSIEELRKLYAGSSPSSTMSSSSSDSDESDGKKILLAIEYTLYLQSPLNAGSQFASYDILNFLSLL